MLRTAPRLAALLAGPVLAAGLLAGCTAPAAPETTASSPAAEPTAGAPAAPAEAALVPGGSADENLPYFEQVISGVVAADAEAPGLSVVDALVAGGFPRESMQLTADETSIGLDADTVLVSVKVGESCLLGQYGAKSDGVHAVVAAPIATGACLVGRTVPLEG
ncbi:hypothetical protein B0T42_09850 [Rathayibacter sp. VKM Ac-2630]|nr:hypothetical protein B0T42_09850 [Rathayibacter sp. VKM Ac-2630]